MNFHNILYGPLYPKKRENINFISHTNFNPSSLNFRHLILRKCFLNEFSECRFILIFSFILQLWCDELMKLAFSLTQFNGSATMFLQKAHVKLCLQVDKSGKIPVKKWVKFYYFSRCFILCAPRLCVFIASDIDFVIKSLPSSSPQTLAEDYTWKQLVFTRRERFFAFAHSKGCSV